MWSSVYICVPSQGAKCLQLGTSMPDGEKICFSVLPTQECGCSDSEEQLSLLRWEIWQGDGYRETEMFSSDFTEYHKLYLVSENVCLCEVHLMILLWFQHQKLSQNCHAFIYPVSWNTCSQRMGYLTFLLAFLPCFLSILSFVMCITTTTIFFMQSHLRKRDAEFCKGSKTNK